MSDLAPIPRLPIPTEVFRIEQCSDKVSFILTDEAIVAMSQDDFRSIRAFFDAAADYAFLVGFRRVTEHRDELRYTTVFTFSR